MVLAGQPRILSLEKAKTLRKQGWKAADLHVHSLCSSDVLSVRPMHPEVLYCRARKLGLSFITFTDHDTMDAYDILGWDRKGLVTGVEIKIMDPDLVGHTIHVNVYDLDKKEFRELEEIALEGDLKDFLATLRRNDLPFVYNHPLWFEAGEKPNLAVIPELVKLFPVVEYNMHRIKRKNEIAVELAERFGKGLIAATDTHSGAVGDIYTLARGESFREFFNNIVHRNSFMAADDLTRKDLTEEINAWIDLISCQDILSDLKDYSIGVKYVDGLIHTLTSETLKGFPRLYRCSLSLCHRISNSGLPALIYLRAERSLIPEIERQLGIVLNENKSNA